MSPQLLRVVAAAAGGLPLPLPALLQHAEQLADQVQRARHLRGRARAERERTPAERGGIALRAPEREPAGAPAAQHAREASRPRCVAKAGPSL